MARLPTPDDQQWIVQHLESLVRTRGAAPFLEARLIEPSDEYFPGAWQPDADGVRMLVERVLGYAGLGALKAHVVLHDREQHDLLEGTGMERRAHFKGAAAWFDGLVDQTCLFGVVDEGLKNPEELVGTLCHEVAHAYRRFHRLETKGKREEWLTDLTSVFLGFGVFVCNNAYRFRTREHLEGSKVMYGWSAKRIGYLPLELLCFALAAQLVARGDRVGGRRVRRLLETNQAAAFDKSCRYLQPHREVLRDMLGLASAPEGNVAPLPISRIVRRTQVPRGALARLAFWSDAREICSNAACQAVLPGFVTRCPQCRGRFDIAPVDDGDDEQDEAG